LLVALRGGSALWHKMLHGMPLQLMLAGPVT